MQTLMRVRRFRAKQSEQQRQLSRERDADRKSYLAWRKKMEETDPIIDLERGQTENKLLILESMRPTLDEEWKCVNAQIDNLKRERDKKIVERLRRVSGVPKDIFDRWCTARASDLQLLFPKPASDKTAFLHLENKRKELEVKFSSESELKQLEERRDHVNAQWDMMWETRNVLEDRLRVLKAYNLKYLRAFDCHIVSCGDGFHLRRKHNSYTGDIVNKAYRIETRADYCGFDGDTIQEWEEYRQKRRESNQKAYTRRAEWQRHQLSIFRLFCVFHNEVYEKRDKVWRTSNPKLIKMLKRKIRFAKRRRRKGEKIVVCM